MGFLKREKAGVTGKTAPYMTFRVGGQLYGVPVDMISEVLALNGLSPLHTGDPAVVGEIELRGSALIVVDMGLRLLGTPIVPSARSCILIVRRGAARSGCLFDDAGGVARIPAEELELSGCLVEGAEVVAALPEADVRTPEDASRSGNACGFPLANVGGEAILIPSRELYYPM